VVKALYRGKFLGLLEDAIRRGDFTASAASLLALHRVIAALRQHDWQVRLKERYAHGLGVTKYLARYVKGGPIADSRVCHVDAQTVTFRYRDHRDGQHKRMSLSTGDFMARVLWHVPEPYQHLVRCAGVYANRAEAKHERCRTHLQQARQHRPSALSWQDYLTQRGYARQTVCPRCGLPLVTVPCARRDQISYKLSHAAAVFVQPLDGATIATQPRPP
jgi:Putative transposase